MSIQTEINRIKSSVNSAYSAVNTKGGTIPDTRNLSNLATSINTIHVALPLSEFGDATAEDVAEGKSFTSANGFKLTGTKNTNVNRPLDPIQVYNTTRPSDWFQMPDFENEEEIQLLVNVPKDGASFLSFTCDCDSNKSYDIHVYECRSRTTVHHITDVTGFTSGNGPQIEFNGSGDITIWAGVSKIDRSFSETPHLTSDGMRQVFIRISGFGNITSWAPATHYKKTSPSNHASWNIVEIKGRLPYVTSFKCTNLNFLQYFSLADENNITNMTGMFRNCYSLVSIPSLNTQKVTDMSNMFAYCYSLVSIPSLNTQNVTNMSNMFGYCYSLPSIPSLNTQNVTNISSMFGYCYHLVSIPSLNTQNVTNMSNMFGGCFSLVSVPSLNTQNVTSITNIFRNCSNLSSLKLTPTITWAGVAIDLKDCSFTRETLLDLFNSLPTITSSKAITLTGNPGVSDLTDEDKAIATNKGWTLTL